MLCKDRNTAAVTAQLTSQSLLYARAGASQVLALKQPPAIQSLLCGRAGASQVLALKQPRVAQSPLCGRLGASANEEPYKEVIPEKRRYLLSKTTNFEGKVEKSAREIWK